MALAALQEVLRKDQGVALVEVALEEVALAALVLVEVALEEAALVEVALAKVDCMRVGISSMYGSPVIATHPNRKGGADVTAEITVGFDEAAFGCEKVIHLTENNGKAVGKALKVKIPAGIDTGKSIRLRGKGNPGINGGKAGDLLLKVKVASKPGYERKGMDVYTTVRVPFTTAVLGGEAKVETLHGNVLCKIPEGTQSGRKIRLKGKGIVSMKDKNQHGDQYVTVQIDVPGNLSEEAKRKLREFEVACKKGQQGVA